MPCRALASTAFAKHVAELSAGKLHDQAELRCHGRHQIGRHAGGDRGRPGAGRRCLRRRAGSRRPDLRAAFAAVSGDVGSPMRGGLPISRGRISPRCCEKKGLRLLYLTPWPPSGIWSKTPLKTPSDLSGLSIRTYDKTSSEVFAGVGARAALDQLFADTMPKLVDGSLNAVLSSGDGGAGRKLWEYLPYFSEITYSLPLSVASVNKAAYDGLSRGSARGRRCGQPPDRDRIVARAVDPAAGELCSACARTASRSIPVRRRPSSKRCDRGPRRRSRPGAASRARSAPGFSTPSKRANHSRFADMTAMLATQRDATPADQFSSASQTRILDLNCSKFAVQHRGQVQLMN